MGKRTWKQCDVLRLLASIGLSVAMATSAIPARALAEGIEGSSDQAQGVTLEDDGAPDGASIALDLQPDDSAEAIELGTGEPIGIDVEDPSPAPPPRRGYQPANGTD